MGTARTVITFKCKKCKTKGSAELSETDHPYSTETYVNDVTEGFRVANVLYPGANVFCTVCNRKVL